MVEDLWQMHFLMYYFKIQKCALAYLQWAISNFKKKYKGSLFDWV